MYSVNTIELKKAMIEAGFTNNLALAKAANISRNTLTRILKGQTKPSLEAMYAIAEVLKLKPQQAGEIFFNNSVA